MEDAVEKYSLTGFDSAGEPHIRKTATGRLWLCIEFMPPSWIPDEQDGEEWDDFGKQLEAEIGVPVVWEDREWFRIEEPKDDTVAAIQRFLHSVRQSFDETREKAGRKKSSERWGLDTVRKHIWDAIKTVAAPFGFRYRANESAFVRKTEAGRQELSVLVSSHNGAFDVSLLMSNRIDAVEEITNRYSGSPAHYHDETLTSVTQLAYLGYLTNIERNALITVRSSEELTEKLTELVSVVEDAVLPFFEEHQHIEDMNEAMNPAGTEEDHEPVTSRSLHDFNSMFGVGRAMKGVAVAFLAGDARIQELTSAYESQISLLPENDRRKFKELVRELGLSR